MNKNDIRSTVLETRRSIDPDDRALWDMLIFERAHKQRAFQQAECIHIYRSVADEVETLPFIEYAWSTGKDVYVPTVVAGSSQLRHVRVTYRTEWTPGAFGILEPVNVQDDHIAEPNRFDEHAVIIVPLVAFDRSCHRLGYGKGYYDRFIAGVSAPTIGLAYQLQLVQQLPTDAHDMSVTCVVTEQRVYVPQTH